MNFKHVLVLAPHTDDAELGCGGSIARFLKEGIQVTVVAFSTAIESLPPDAPPDTLEKEFLTAMDAMGVLKSNVQVHKFPVRRFSEHRQEILELLIRIRRETKPDLVFLPSSTDCHQDHEVIHREGVRAFKEVTVFGYELPWNNISFSADAFITLRLSHLEEKWKALQSYKSQIELKKPYFTWELVESIARLRGIQAKELYAEAFEVIRIKL